MSRDTLNSDTAEQKWNDLLRLDAELCSLSRRGRLPKSGALAGDPASTTTWASRSNPSAHVNLKRRVQTRAFRACPPCR